MVRRRNRSKEPAEKGYECIEEGCDSVVKNRFFPEHYETHHRMRSGRFECSFCGYKCSYKAVCIAKHIRRVHKNSEARVIYNPYLNQEECRIKNEHTDECGDEKAKVKPKRTRASKKKTSGKGKNKRQAARGSKDTINEIVVADETEEMDLPAASRCKRNLEPDFERSAKRKRCDNLISNSDVTNTAKEKGKHLDLVIEEEEEDVITIEEEDSEVATSDNESENEETGSKITSNQPFRGTSAENNGNNISKQNLKQGEDSEEEEEDDDIIDDETIDYDDAGSDESDESGVEEVEIENVIVKAEKNEDSHHHSQEVSEANPTDEERIQKRMEIDRHIQLEGHIIAHDRYSEAMLDDLIEDLISKFTTNPKQPTTNLIKELTGKNPHELIWNKVSCPSKLGDETKINEVLESVIESANKLQVHVIELLISTSKGFKKELAKKLWETLKLRAAVYRVDETMGYSEELKVKLLSLKCLYEAYKKANR